MLMADGSVGARPWVVDRRKPDLQTRSKPSRVSKLFRLRKLSRLNMAEQDEQAKQVE